jgi:hypothetical protein
MVPHLTKDTGRSAKETCFLVDLFPLDSQCFTHFPGAEWPFSRAGPLELETEFSDSVPKSWNHLTKWLDNIYIETISSEETSIKKGDKGNSGIF